MTNMALLDSIFPGEQGITAILAKMLGGDAIVICPGEQGAYNPETDAYEEMSATEYPVKFIQEVSKHRIWTHVGGVQVEAGDLVGMIPAYMIKVPLRKRVDHFRRNGINYIIESTEEISSGDAAALVRILCKKTHDVHR